MGVQRVKRALPYSSLSTTVLLGVMVSGSIRLTRSADSSREVTSLPQLVKKKIIEIEIKNINIFIGL